ncbi:MAG: hypothetical protein BWY78_00159 [Alphaproteobacteria bacterium ADurb.Bin438]|nr:MAG: hypothetical protein BWY78_00159 [Alphaproteobacteria bacterium ADurb.Bin438]
MKFRILSDEEVKKLYDLTFLNYKKQGEEFLVQNGVSKDLSSYDKVLNSVGKIFETCAIYGMDIEDNKNSYDGFDIDSVKGDILSVLKSDNHVEAVQKYEQELPIKAHRYKELLDKTINNGLNKKQAFNPEYPEILKDKDKVFLEVQDIYPINDYITSFCNDLNEFTTPYGKEFSLKEVKGNPRISFNGAEIKPIHAFSQNLKFIESLNINKLDYKDDQLFSVLKKGNYNNFKALIRTRKEQAKAGEVFKNEELCRAYDKSELLFYHMGKKFNDNLVPNVMMTFKKTCDDLKSYYKDINKKLEYSSGMSGFSHENDTPVNIVMVSKDPYDIATSSAYNAPEWTCFHPLGLRSTGVNNHYVLEDDIAKGSVVYRGFHKNNMNKVVFRAIGSQYKNPFDGKKIYDFSLPIGKRGLEVDDTMKQINKQMLNDKDAEGLFELQNTTYIAMFATETPVIKSFDEDKQMLFKDFNKALGVNVDIIKDNNDTFEAVQSFQISKKDKINVDIIFPKNLEVAEDFEISGNSKIQNLSSNKMKVGGSMYISDCKSLKTLPKSLKVGGSVYLENLENLTSLPDKVESNSYIRIDNCPNLKYIPETIKDEQIKGIDKDKIKEFKENWSKKNFSLMVLNKKQDNFSK